MLKMIQIVRIINLAIQSSKLSLSKIMTVVIAAGSKKKKFKQKNFHFAAQRKYPDSKDC